MEDKSAFTYLISQWSTGFAMAEAIKLHYINHMVEHHGLDRQALTDEINAKATEIFKQHQDQLRQRE